MSNKIVIYTFLYCEFKYWKMLDEGCGVICEVFGDSSVQKKSFIKKSWNVMELRCQTQSRFFADFLKIMKKATFHLCLFSLGRRIWNISDCAQNVVVGEKPSFDGLHGDISTFRFVVWSWIHYLSNNHTQTHGYCWKWVCGAVGEIGIADPEVTGSIPLAPLSGPVAQG